MNEYRYTDVRTVNGYKYRDVERYMPQNEFGDYVWDFCGVQVLTPNCDWVDDMHFCQKLCDNCPIAEFMKEQMEIGGNP